MGSQPKGISASRGAAVLGLSEFQTPFEVFQKIMEERESGWNEAHGYSLPANLENAATRWGTAFESAVVELAEREQGEEIIDRELFFSVNAMPGDVIFERTIDKYGLPNFITCHIDGRYKESSDTEPYLLHEGKTTSAFTFREKWGEPGTDHIPRSYQVQIQHQMLCTGAPEAIVSVLVFPETPDKWETMGWKTIKVQRGSGDQFSYLLENNETRYKCWPQTWAAILSEMGYFHQYPIKANPAVQKLLVEKYTEFWEKHILTGTPPEPRTYEDIKRLCPEPKSTIIVPDFIEHKIAEYKGITEESTRNKQRKERLKTIITKYAAIHSGIVDEESTEAVVFRNASGEKLGTWSKRKDSAMIFRC